MGKVEPLPEVRGERPAPVVGRPPPRRRVDPPRPVRFEVETWGDQLEGRAPGVGKVVLRRLRRGRHPVEARVDLHGMTRVEARVAVEDLLARARMEGQRCLLVVHGRGLHSEGWPVLKESLPGWLARAPHARHVRAFVTAPPSEGGAGATLVLLKERRR